MRLSPHAAELKRSQLLQIYDAVLDTVAANSRRNVEGQIDLFGGFFDGGEAAAAVPSVRVPELPELSRAERMAMEKETTGLYLSGHPMDDYRALLHGRNIAPIGEIMESFANHTDEYFDEQVVSIAGIVQTVRMKTTKNNSMMAYVTLEDDTGSIQKEGGITYEM